MSDAPAMPQGVRLVRANGDDVPLELVYMGREDRDGLSVDAWEAVLTVRFERGDHLALDVLPARCAVRLRLDVT